MVRASPQRVPPKEVLLRGEVAQTILRTLDYHHQRTGEQLASFGPANLPLTLAHRDRTEDALGTLVREGTVRWSPANEQFPEAPGPEDMLEGRIYRRPHLHEAVWDSGYVQRVRSAVNTAGNYLKGMF